MQWYFEPFRLDADNACLWRHEQRVALRPKTFNLLAQLVEHAGTLLTKETLLDAVWPDAFVTEGVLATSMAELRKALGETARQPRFIATEHKRGYRFIAPVTAVELAAPPSRASQPPSLLIDRGAELECLRQALTAARRGQRQAVMVTGEAGIGKTTLVDAFLGELVEQENIYVGRGQCIDHYGPSEPYLPLLDAVGDLAQAGYAQLVQAILRQRAPSWLLQLPALLSPDEAARLRQDVLNIAPERMLRELADAVETLSVAQPLVIVLEDLHWSDASTLNWLAYISRRRVPSQLLIVGTYRPVDAAMRDHPVRGVTQELRLHGLCDEVELDFWSETGVAAFLAQRFGAQIASADLVRLLHQRTQGNPLFLIALVNALIGQGILIRAESGWRAPENLEAAAIIVPSDLQQLVEYHLLRLQPGDQSLLEAASAAGAAFTSASVAAGLAQDDDSVEARCQTLARLGQFIRETGVETWPDGAMTSAYQFTHAIYHEVVYARMAAGSRQRLHRRIAARLQTAYADRLTEAAAQLAFHHGRGQEFAQAVRFHHLAAQHALSRSGYQEAIAQAREGLARLPHLAESTERQRREFDLRMSLGPALMAIKGYGDAKVEQAYSRALDLCDALGEATRMFPVLWGLWRFHNSQGNFQTARRVGDQLLSLAQDQNDAAQRLAAHQALGFTLFYLGQFQQARTHLEAGAALIDAETQLALAHQYGSAPGVTCLALLAQVLWALGYADQARQRCREACALADALAHPHSQVSARFVTARVCVYCRDAASVRQHVDALMALAAEQAFAQRVAAGQFLRGWLLVMQGEAETGRADMRSGLADILDTGAVIYQPWCQLLLAEAHGREGQTEAGLRLISEAFGVVDQDKQSYVAAELYRVQGELLLRRTPAEMAQAERSLQQALDIAQRQQAKAWELRAAISLARLWNAQGKRQAALGLLKPTYRWFTEGLDTADLQEAQQLLHGLEYGRSD